MNISKIESGGCYNCFDNLIIAISNEAKKNYELMSLYSWNFNYLHITNSQNQNIGSQLNADNNTDYSLLEEYHGLKVDFFVDNDGKSFHEKLPMELKRNDCIIIKMNTFWCAWMEPYYKLINGSHCCIVSEIKDNGDLVILDSEYACNKALLLYSDYISGFKGYILVNFIQSTKNVINDWKKLLLKSIQNMYYLENNINKFDDIVRLSLDIQNGVDFECEITNYKMHPFKSEIFQKIHTVGQHRKQFSKSLKYIADLIYSENLLNLSTEAHNCGNEWSSIFGMLCKLYISGSPLKLQQRIFEKINALSVKENKLYIELYNLCTSDVICNNYSTSIKLSDYSNDGSNYHLINISKFYNNNGTSNSLITSSALSYGNRFLYLKENCSSTFEISGMKFYFPNTSSISKDNISCEEQIISLDISEKKYIMFLGCSELGDHVDTIKLTFEDDSYDYYPLKLTNWLKSSADYNDVIAIKGKAFELAHNKLLELPFTGYIYAIKYTIKDSKRVKSIQLPYCPNIHVFAISFCD